MAKNLVTKRRFERALYTIKLAISQDLVSGDSLDTFEHNWPKRTMMSLIEVVENFHPSVKMRRSEWAPGRWVQYFQREDGCFHRDETGAMCVIDVAELNAMDWEILED